MTTLLLGALLGALIVVCLLNTVLLIYSTKLTQGEHMTTIDKRFRDPAVFNADGSVRPHKFVSDEPYHVACMACGGAVSAKIDGKPLHPR